MVREWIPGLPPGMTTFETIHVVSTILLVCREEFKKPKGRIGMGAASGNFPCRVLTKKEACEVELQARMGILGSVTIVPVVDCLSSEQLEKCMEDGVFERLQGMYFLFNSPTEQMTKRLAKRLRRMADMLDRLAIAMAGPIA